MTIREVEAANGYRNYTQAEVDILLKIRLLCIGFIGRLLLFYASLALMLAFEPLLLHFFGATPGKAILGLRIETSDGSCLSLSAARNRTRGVFRQDLASRFRSTICTAAFAVCSFAARECPSRGTKRPILSASKRARPSASPGESSALCSSVYSPGCPC